MQELVHVCGLFSLLRRLICVDRTMSSAQTSKDLLQEWTTTRQLHFTKWTADVKKRAIRSCVLGLSEYGNNTKRDNILEHLSHSELPLYPGKVLATLNDAGFLHAGARSRQQHAYILLRNITPLGPLPVLYVKEESVLHITGPGRELLATVAREVLDTHLILDYSPHFYRFDTSKKRLWQARLQVCRTLEHIPLAQN